MAQEYNLLCPYLGSKMQTKDKSLQRPNIGRPGRQVEPEMEAEPQDGGRLVFSASKQQVYLEAHGT